MDKLKKSKFARHERKSRDIHPDEVEDAIVQNARKKLVIPVGTKNAVPCVRQTRIPTANGPTQNVAVSKEGGRPLALSERRLSVSMGKRNRSVRNFTEGELIRMRITLQIEDFIRGIITIWFTRPCRSAKAMKIPSVKFAAKEGRMDEILFQVDGRKDTAWSVFMFTDKLNCNVNKNIKGRMSIQRVIHLQRSQRLEGPVLRTNQHCNLCAKGVVILKLRQIVIHEKRSASHEFFCSKYRTTAFQSDVVPRITI